MTLLTPTTASDQTVAPPTGTGPRGTAPTTTLPRRNMATGARGGRRAYGPSADANATAERQCDEAVLAEALAIERRRLARTLHDDFVQLLSIASIRLSSVARASHGTSIGESLHDVQELVTEACSAIRSLMADLTAAPGPQGAAVGDGSAAPTPSLKSPQSSRVSGTLTSDLVVLAEQMRGEFGLHADVDGATVFEPEAQTRQVLLRSVRELLVNSVKHAASRSVRINLDSDAHWIRVEVSDDGVGFDPSRLTFQPTGSGGCGLRNIRDDLADIGGRMTIDSAVGRGTTITLSAPRPGVTIGHEPTACGIGPAARATAMQAAGSARKSSDAGLRYMHALNDRLAGRALPGDADT